jgi:hypothetical protein
VWPDTKQEPARGGTQPLRVFVRERFTSATMKQNAWFDLRQKLGQWL